MDAAASHANALLPVYCTIDGKFVKSDVAPTKRNPYPPVGYTVVHASPLGGLDTGLWKDERAFYNPPYDNGISDWIKTAQEADAEVSVGLLLASIDPEWFHNLWPEVLSQSAWIKSKSRYHGVRFLHEGKAHEIRFYRGRERFLRPKRNIQLAGPNGESILIPDETDPESVVGEAPRAGNIVYIVERL